ncbi:MAG: hypothetical protein JKY43_05710 [Phycisphaerales bacterium]|nr:hypothetical protein [Phycisphaerales bacterium]
MIFTTEGTESTEKRGIGEEKRRKRMKDPFRFRPPRLGRFSRRDGGEEIRKTPSDLEDSATSPVRTGEEQERKQEREEDEEKSEWREEDRRTWSPHPGPLPSEWEREEERREEMKKGRKEGTRMGLGRKKEERKKRRKEGEKGGFGVGWPMGVLRRRMGCRKWTALSMVAVPSKE